MCHHLMKRERDSKLDNELSPVGVARCDEVDGTHDHTPQYWRGNPCRSVMGPVPSSVSCEEGTRVVQ